MKKLLFFLALIATLMNACDYTDHKLKIKNSSGSNGYFIIYDSSSLNAYPNKVLNLDNNFILDGSTKKMSLFNQSWEEYVKNSSFGGLIVFVIHEDTVARQSKNSIIKNKMYSKHFFSLKELERKNWLVVIH